MTSPAMEPVALLRDTAKQIRERANMVPPGPWAEWPVDPRPRRHVGTDKGIPFAEVYEASERSQIAAHMASWGPAVALAVAGLLDREADHLEQHISAWTEPPGVAHNNPQRLAQLIEHHYGHVLAVARAYGGAQ